jgi:peroxiredoxin
MSPPLAAGEAAPSFRCGDGRSLLERCREAGAFLLFLPLADAPVCRADVQQLALAAPELGAPLRPLLVVSVDGAAHGARFLREVAHAPLEHLCDRDLALAKAFGVARRDGVAERATFLLDRDGRVVAGAVHPIGFPRPLALLREWLAKSDLSAPPPAASPARPPP